MRLSHTLCSAPLEVEHLAALANGCVYVGGCNAIHFWRGSGPSRGATSMLSGSLKQIAGSAQAAGRRQSFIDNDLRGLDDGLDLIAHLEPELLGGGAGYHADDFESADLHNRFG